MRVEALFIGTELLDGKLNTHLPELAHRLSEAGLTLSRAGTIGDSQDDIEHAFRDALSRSGAVICFGGLGPTFDDLTREGAAAAVGRKLVLVPALLKEIEERFARRGIAMSPDNKRQAYLIEGGKAIGNARGSAPGQRLTLPDGKMIFLLPGPGHEMRPMLEGVVLPAIKKAAKAKPLQRLEFHAAGLLESQADEMLKPLIRANPETRFTILAGTGVVSFYAVVAPGKKPDALRRQIREILGKHLFSEQGESLAESVGRALLKAKQTIALAESCTGGLVTGKLTDIPGSSRYVRGGLVAYSNELKEAELGVSADVLKKEGAVSGACAEAMAKGARTRYGATWGLSITGIAGPDGGTKDKPVGLVFVGVSGPKGTLSKKLHIGGDRFQVRERSVTAALYMLWRQLARKP